MKQYIITLIVLLLPIDPPSVTVTPLSQVVNMSDTVTITCTVFALPPPTITWTDDRNSAIVLPGGRFSITQSDSGNTRTSILSFNGILKEDESNYTCTAVNNVTNVIGALRRGSSILKIQGAVQSSSNGQIFMCHFCTYFLVPATVQSLTDLVLHRSLGDNVTFMFSLSKDDPPVETQDIEWFFIFNSFNMRTVITNSANDRYNFSPNRLSLTIVGITLADQGQYILEATNAAGTRSNSSILSVVGKCIMQFPRKQLITANHSVQVSLPLSVVQTMRKFVVREMM